MNTVIITYPDGHELTVWRVQSLFFNGQMQELTLMVDGDSYEYAKFVYFQAFPHKEYKVRK